MIIIRKIKKLKHMKNDMIYYPLHQILEVASTLALTKDLMVSLEKNLRETESFKTKVPEQNITEISYETFLEVIGCLTDEYDAVIMAILEKFQTLGYKAGEKKVPFDPQLN